MRCDINLSSKPRREQSNKKQNLKPTVAADLIWRLCGAFNRIRVLFFNELSESKSWEFMPTTDTRPQPRSATEYILMDLSGLPRFIISKYAQA